MRMVGHALYVGLDGRGWIPVTLPNTTVRRPRFGAFVVPQTMTTFAEQSDAVLRAVQSAALEQRVGLNE
ncbi:MAG: hypothetical protein AAFS10_18745 [Myxococcota bacterium]